MSIGTWSKIRTLYRSRPTLPARFHIAFGLSSLVTTVLLLALFLGFVPDRDSAVAKGRISLSEALAASSSRLIERSDLSGLRSNLEFAVERNTALGAIELHRIRNDSNVVFGDESLIETESSLLVPLFRGNREWGELRFHFMESIGASWIDRWRDSQFGLMIFVSLVSFPAFYFYLGKMLKELNPSAAVPGRVRSALDTIAEALIVIDKQGDIVLANAAFATLNGRSAESLIGVHADSLAWVLKDEDSEICPWQDALINGEPTRNTMIGFTDHANDIKKYLINCSPITGAKGRVGGVLISMDDVTLLEEKEVLLRESMLAAEEANQAKSAFLSNMSHEIRTPMTAILGFTEVLKRGLNLSGEERSKHLMTISNSGQHLLELINDVLDLSKVESGAMEVENIETSVANMAHEVVKVLRVKAEEKKIELSMIIESDLPEYILSDPSRLRQVMTNLLGNAIKFTEKGGVTLSLSHDEYSERISIAVSDTGIGMNEAQAATIFDAFVQADTSITRRFGGTGLGLSISRKLVEALGGDIHVNSQPGKGSTFLVLLPTGEINSVPRVSSEELFASFDQSKESVATHWTFPASRVLVVDDGDENRELLSIVLNDLGISVTLAENGLVAYELTKQDVFDLVLMDIQMPIMDGYEAAEAMRTAGIKWPIVALTANAMKGYERRILDSGFSHYRTKPIDLDNLTELLAQLLGGKRSTISERKNDSTTGCELQISASQVSEAPIFSSLNNENPKFAVIVERFLEKLPGKMSSMRMASDSGDWITLGDLAHWLKGSGGTVGFGQLYEPAAALEAASKAGDRFSASSTLAELEILVERFRTSDAVSTDSQKIDESSVTDDGTRLSNSEVFADTPVTSTLLVQSPKFYSIVERFIPLMTTQIQSMEKAFDEDDLVSVADHAHWLKGSGGNVGYEGFTTLGENLESSIRMNDRESIRLRINSIRQYANRIVRGWDDSQLTSKSA